MNRRLAPVLLVLAVLWESAYAPAAETWSRLPVDGGEVAPAPLPVEVPADSAALRYDGRFERTNAREPVCAWSASAVTVRFRGTAVNVRLGLGANRFVAAVDGIPVKILAVDNAVERHPPSAPAPILYALASGLPMGEHRVTVFKATEAAVGNATFAGFQLSEGATVLPVASAKRKLLVVGDSISCGYGNEAASGNENFSVATENAWWTYGAIAARAAGADYECIAWSGRKMYPDNTIPEVYDRTLPTEPGSRWPGGGQPADAILVNLCTNDFHAPTLPDRAGWVKAYRGFVARLRKDAPEATIYCALGSMLMDDPGRPSLTYARQWIEEVVADCRAAGDAKVRFLEFATQRPADGLGVNNHPSVRTHQIMAGVLTGALRADLGW